MSTPQQPPSRIALDNAVLNFLEDVQAVFPELSDWTQQRSQHLDETIAFFRTCPGKQANTVDKIAEAAKDESRDMHWLPGLPLSTLTTCSGVSDATRTAIYQHLANIYEKCPSSEYQFPVIQTQKQGNLLPIGKYVSVFDQLKQLQTDAQDHELIRMTAVSKWVIYSGVINAYLTTHTDAIMELVGMFSGLGIDVLDLLEHKDDEKYMTKLMAMVMSKLAKTDARSAIADQMKSWVAKWCDPDYSPVHYCRENNVSTLESGPLPTPSGFISDMRIICKSEVGQQFFAEHKIDPKVGMDLIDKIEADYVQNGNFDKTFSDITTWIKEYAEKLMKPNTSSARNTRNEDKSQEEDDCLEASMPLYKDERARVACEKLRTKLAGKKKRNKQCAPEVTEAEMTAYYEKSLDELVREIENTNSLPSNKEKTKPKK
jgi:hypothetical protein